MYFVSNGTDTRCMDRTNGLCEKALVGFFADFENGTGILLGRRD